MRSLHVRQASQAGVRRAVVQHERGSHRSQGRGSQHASVPAPTWLAVGKRASWGAVRSVTSFKPPSPFSPPPLPLSLLLKAAKPTIVAPGSSVAAGWEAGGGGCWRCACSLGCSPEQSWQSLLATWSCEQRSDSRARVHHTHPRPQLPTLSSGRRPWSPRRRRVRNLPVRPCWWRRCRLTACSRRPAPR